VASAKPSSSHSRISDTFTELTDALTGAAENPRKKVVHHLRTNTRRLETIIQNRLPGGSRKKLLRELKAVSKAAGRVRDVDVQKKLVDNFESDHSKRGRAFVSARLDLLRARNEKKLIQLLSPETLDDFRQQLKQCERQLASPSPAHPRGEDDVNTALEQYSKLLCKFEPLTRDNIHDFRKACKQVRYLAELGADNARKNAVLDALKHIQDSIGGWHDVLTLVEVAKAALKSPRRSAFIQELRQAEEKKFQESLETCQNAKQELMRLHAEQLAGSRKQPRGTAPASRAQSRAAS